MPLPALSFSRYTVSVHLNIVYTYSPLTHWGHSAWLGFQFHELANLFVRFSLAKDERKASKGNCKRGRAQDKSKTWDLAQALSYPARVPYSCDSTFVFRSVRGASESREISKLSKGSVLHASQLYSVTVLVLDLISSVIHNTNTVTREAKVEIIKLTLTSNSK